MDHKIGVIPMAIRDQRIALMFVTSQQRGRWILPKGNLKANETHSEGCTREAFEEAGIKGNIIADFPITAAISKSSAQGIVQTAVTYYPFLVTEQLSDWPEKAKRERHWVLLRDAHHVSDRDDFRTLINQFEAISPSVLKSVEHRI